MIPFSASSRGGRGTPNNDGSRSVYCYSCNSFLGTSFDNINKALCEVCRRIENNEPPLTAEALQRYDESKLGRTDVTLVVVPEPPKIEGVKHKRFSFATISGTVLSALGRFGLREGETTTDTQPVSAMVAQSKRRKRLFADIDLDEKK